MEEKEVMDLLRYYRHDIMNDLQIVHAYTSMGKLEKVEEKLATYMAHFDEERKLMNLNAPNLALWLIPFNSIHPNFRFTYAIRDEKLDISDIDEKLTTDCQYCITCLEEITHDQELYEGELVLEYLKQRKQIQVVLTLHGSFSDLISAKIPAEMKNITLQKSENYITCTVTNQWNRKGEE
ncbi:sporulation initiation phosphotransferase B [Virgibacillus necropolis]|uniref:Spo0B domain-containing protein n=1 Tax=Virgibacillus necropolis TaxID=163877 RepID=UPI00384EA781